MIYIYVWVVSLFIISVCVKNLSSDVPFLFQK